MFGQVETMEGGGGASKQTIGDAVEYIHYMKKIFHDKPEKYDEFIQILKDVRANRLDEAGGKAQVKELMKGYVGPLLRFNAFFPGAEITIPPEAEERIENAQNLMNKLETRFQGDDRHVFESFMETMKTFNQGNMSVKELNKEILSLLRGHQDLNDDFTRNICL